MADQKTIKNPVSFEGIGLHTGKITHVRILPAPENTGVVFVYDGVEIPASIEYISGLTRNTELSKADKKINTVEHVLAALKGMEISNAIVEMKTGEPPSLDGSAYAYAKQISEAGIVTQDAVLKPAFIDEPFVAGNKNAYIACMPSDRFLVTYILDYKHAMIDKMIYHYDVNTTDFLNEVSKSRTFALIEEVETLRKAGLALGGSVDNAVVVYSDRYSSPLRFPDEFARHKTLDMIGDISLAGSLEIKAHFIGVLSGHALNAEAVKLFVKKAKII